MAYRADMFIDVAEAAARFDLRRILRSGVLDDIERIRLLEPGSRVEGDLDLDASPVLAAGDVHVDGNVVGAEDGSFLVVLGSCRASNVLVGGPEVYIQGDLSVRNAVMTDYNHGRLEVGGALAAAIVLAEHLTRVRGPVSGITVDFGGLRVETDGFEPTVSRDRATHGAKDVFVPEVLNDGGYVEGRLLRNRLRDGLPVLRD